MGTVIDPVPVTGLAANFSPMPRMAPPPLGRIIAGGEEVPFGGSPFAFPPDSDGLWPIIAWFSIARSAVLTPTRSLS